MSRAFRSKAGGFSLVEISLAIGIIAFAFVGLIGLLPIGLQTFRNAIDTSNETRIVQSFSSKLLATEYEKLGELDFEKSGDISYFDEEGMYVDSELIPLSARAADRLYESKIFIQPAPKIEGMAPLASSVNAVIVFANIASKADKEFQAVQSFQNLQKHLQDREGKSELKVRPILISKMDGQPR